MKNSNLFSLPTSKEWLKGLYLTVIVAVLTTSLQMLTRTPPSIDFKEIGIVALTALVAYLVKTITSNNDGTPFAKDGDGAVIPSKGF